MIQGPLIDANTLMSHLGDEVVICDVRWDLTAPERARQRYRDSHIPDSVFVDLDTDLADPPGNHGRHPLPTTTRFAQTLGRLGISPETAVVVCDDVGGRYAARMWWMLRAIGHQNVLVLDGGLEGWVDGGNPVESGERTNPPARYPVPCQFTGVVTHDGLSGRTVIDARSAERYRGDQEPLDPVAGHIPGAVNIPTDENLDENGRFKDQSDLRVLYAEVEDSPVVSCGSGVTACHDALAMVVAGREMPDIYVGSYSEWSRLGLPVTTGEDP